MSQLANVVIYLESDAHRPLSAAGPQVIMRVRSAMAQSNERFQPHVLPVLLGATVEFPNQDDVFHNVFSLSATSKFDLGRYPKGASKSVRFDKPGAVQVFCHIHADMSAIVLVLSNPFFATPDAAGRFAIDDVPPGEYTIVGWHERTKPVVRHVTVAAAQTTTLDFNIPVSAPARTASR